MRTSSSVFYFYAWEWACAFSSWWVLAAKLEADNAPRINRGLAAKRCDSQFRAFAIPTVRGNRRDALRIYGRRYVRGRYRDRASQQVCWCRRLCLNVFGGGPWGFHNRSAEFGARPQYPLWLWCGSGLCFVGWAFGFPFLILWVVFRLYQQKVWKQMERAVDLFFTTTLRLAPMAVFFGEVAVKQNMQTRDGKQRPLFSKASDRSYRTRSTRYSRVARATRRTVTAMRRQTATTKPTGPARNVQKTMVYWELYGS